MIQKVLLDDSVHISTYDVADQKAVEEPLHIRLNSRSRSVRFVEDENEYFDDSFPRTERECAICWYTNDDTEVFKASLQALLRKAQNEDKKKNLNMMKVIKSYYTQCSSLDYEVEDVDEILSAEDVAILASLFRSSRRSAFLGLEFYFVPSLKKEAQKKREKLQDTVLDVQLEHEQGILSDSEYLEELRDSCMVYSQASCLFAQILAKAQYMSLQ